MWCSLQICISTLSCQNKRNCTKFPKTQNVSLLESIKWGIGDLVRKLEVMCYICCYIKEGLVIFTKRSLFPYTDDNYSYPWNPKFVPNFLRSGNCVNAPTDNYGTVRKTVCPQYITKVDLSTLVLLYGLH